MITIEQATSTSFYPEVLKTMDEKQEATAKEVLKTYGNKCHDLGEVELSDEAFKMMVSEINKSHSEIGLKEILRTDMTTWADDSRFNAKKADMIFFWKVNRKNIGLKSAVRMMAFKYKPELI